MPYDPRKLLEDIRRAAEFLLTHTAGRSLDDYRADEALRSVVERKFEIIGEALVRLRKADPTIADQFTDHRKIVSFRNVLIHGYDQVDHDVVWKIVIEDLPVLYAEVVTRLQ